MGANIRLTKQEVRIDGIVAGYQFARYSMGKRTVYTSVYQEEQNSDSGIVYWRGRTLLVNRRFPGAEAQCLRNMWVAVEEVR